MTIEQALWLLLVAGAGIGVAVLAYGIARLGQAMAARTTGDLDDKLAKALRLPLAVFAGVVASGLALVLLQGRLSETQVDQSRQLLVGVFLALAFWGLVRVVRAFLERAGTRHTRFQPAARVGSRLVALVLYTMAFLMVLSIYGISITPVLTGLGIAGLAVALALQDTGANFFAGIWIQTGKPMQPGHYVKVEGQQGLDGYVEEVGWRVTRIRTLGGNTIVIPNNELAQSIVTDFNLPAKDMSVVMTFRSGLEQDPKKVVAALVEEAKEAYKALPGSFVQAKGAEPFAQVSTISEDAIKYSLIVRVPEYVQQWTAQHDIYQRVLARYTKEGWRMPYPTRHNYSEPVKPEAHRVPGAPGGLAPRGRPKPRRREEPPTEDPRLAEAKKAEQEIAAKQRQKEAKAETKGVTGEPAKAAAAGAGPADAAKDGKALPAEEAREERAEEDAADARAGAAATTRLG